MLITDSPTAPGRRRLSVIEASVALPGAVLLSIVVAMLFATAVQQDVLWQTEALTLPEAAALRDEAEVVRLIDQGADPNEAGVIRAGFITNDAIVLTPLEAAVAIRRQEMVDLLVRRGARPDADTWTRMMCFATSLERDDLHVTLERLRPAGVVPDCGDLRIPW